MSQLSNHERQQRYCRVIKYIRQIIASVGYSPTIREIGNYMGWSSSGTTAMHLQRMRELGLID
ncbi:hypothetical protein [Lacticaseibacillus saniviri]|uniref:LexA family protein n=1 Tax=Lacticaseibacillus saniviri TaxID=931533 RepID=UPI001EDD3EB5|nr:hypothetical protein [Lacticaseibacillus saniviri]MCG4280892.1 hypothetical protein [Lacticaseibacillus saniviri]